MTDVTVATSDLRAALTAVVVHADQSKEPMPAFAHVRCLVGDVNLTVSATTGFSAGHAIVSVIDNADGEVGEPFDLSPRDVKEILAIFPNPKDEEYAAELRLHLSSEHLTVTDVGGLFDGKQLVLPRQAVSDDFPDIESVIRLHMLGGRAGRFHGERLVANGQRLASFNVAARAYGEPLVIEPAGQQRALLVVMCGESFIGILTTSRVDEDSSQQLNEWRDAWLRRLPDTPRWSTGKTVDATPSPVDDDTSTDAVEAWKNAVRDFAKDGGTVTVLAPSK